MLFTNIGNYVNFIGFRYVLGLSYEIDSITDLDSKDTLVFGAEGFAFSDAEPRLTGITFNPQSFGPGEIEPELANHPVIMRASFELRNSIKYPDYTALHCYLALDAIRNHFDSSNDKNGWELLRLNLNIKRDSIEKFKDAADCQRHGKNKSQDWNDRRIAMQTGWEVLHRFVAWFRQPHSLPLSDPKFPSF